MGPRTQDSEPGICDKGLGFALHIFWTCMYERFLSHENIYGKLVLMLMLIFLNSLFLNRQSV